MAQGMIRSTRGILTVTRTEGAENERQETYIPRDVV